MRHFMALTNCLQPNAQMTALVMAHANSLLTNACVSTDTLVSIAAYRHAHSRAVKMGSVWLATAFAKKGTEA